MRKLLIVLLMLGVTAGAFAQNEEDAVETPTLAARVAALEEKESGKTPALSISLIADFRPSLFQYSGRSSTQNENLTAGRIDFFSYPSGSDHDYRVWGPEENQLKLITSYKKNNISGHLRLSLDNLVRRSGGFVANDGKQANGLTSQILNQDFDEWNVQGTLGHFTAFFGNTANRGLVGAYQGFENLKFRQEQFGVVTPGGARAPEIPRAVTEGSIPWPTPAGNWTVDGKNPPENANFGKLFNTVGNHSQEDVPYFLVRGKFDPLTVEVAGDLTGRSGLTGSAWYTFINGGVRFSAEKLADLVTFDVTYRLRGGDPSTDTANDKQPDGVGKTTHSFTLASQFGLLDDALGIQLAYTGQFRLYEDQKVGDAVVEQTGPYFSGVDLRFQYTGIDPFQFNLNNNVSFSTISEEKFTGSGLDKETTLDFWDGLINSTADTSYNWFSMYNALGAQYRLNEKIKFWLEVGNKLSVLTSTLGSAVRNDQYNVLGASIKTVYAFSSYISMEAGLAFYYATYTWSINDTKHDFSVTEGGTSKALDSVTTSQTVFQIPLRVRLVL